MKSWQKTAVALAIATFAGAVAAESMPVRGTGDYSWDSLKPFDSMDFSGVTITVAGPWLAPENGYIRRALEPFEKATGATIKYSGSDSFEQQILIDAQAGTPPNLAIFPQPGLAADLASRGYLTPAPDKVRQGVLDNYAAGQSWVDLATYADKSGKEQFYGVFFRVDVKSLVWYSPDNFDEYGYEVPETLEELMALSEQIVKDGNTPWCIGLGSGAATGWPATDWVEDLMLRTQPASVYDQWVSHDIRFNDSRVVKAIETFGEIAKNDDYFPAYASKDLGKPVLGSGTVAAITKPTKATEALLEYLLTPLAHELWMEKGGFLTANKLVNTDLYKTDTERAMGDILLNATTFRFDGSDLMPGAIGAGAFWTGMVDYVSGASAQSIATDIENAWKELEK
ncbi:MAG: ABC transporter substrate-binding protein [Reinekea sp.]